MIFFHNVPIKKNTKNEKVNVNSIVWQTVAQIGYSLLELPYIIKAIHI